MKINEIVLWGFTRKELDDIHSGTGKSGEEQFSLDFANEIADTIGCDVMTLVLPDGTVSLIKAGE